MSSLRSLAPTLPSPSRSTHGSLVILAAALAVTAIAYLPILRDPFFEDDIGILSLARNFDLTQLDPIANPGGVFRPTWSLYFAAAFRIFGLAVTPYHLVSITVHGAVGVVLFLVAWRLLPSPVAASMASLLFLLSSHVTGAVHCVGAMSALLDGFFTCLTILMALWGLERRSPATVAAAALPLALALGSRESAAVAPLLLVATIVARGDRPPRSLLPSFLPLAVVWIGLFAFHAIRLRTHRLAVEGLYTIAAGRMAWRMYEYMAKILVSTSGASGAVLLAAIIAYAIVGRDRAARLGLLWMAIAIVPFTPIATGGVPERYAYVPAMGAALVQASILSRAWRAFQSPPVRLLPLALGTVLAVKGVIGIRRDIRVFHHRCVAFQRELDRIDRVVGPLREDQVVAVDTTIWPPYVEEHLKLSRGLRRIRIVPTRGR